MLATNRLFSRGYCWIAFVANRFLSTAYLIRSRVNTWTFGTNAPCAAARQFGKTAFALDRYDGLSLLALIYKLGRLHVEAPCGARAIVDWWATGVDIGWPVSLVPGRRGTATSTSPPGVWPFGRCLSVYCMNIATGDVVWRNDRMEVTCSGSTRTTPSDPGGLAPQGLLVDRQDELIRCPAPPLFLRD